MSTQFNNLPKEIELFQFFPEKGVLPQTGGLFEYKNRNKKNAIVWINPPSYYFFHYHLSSRLPEWDFYIPYFKNMGRAITDKSISSNFMTSVAEHFPILDALYTKFKLNEYEKVVMIAHGSSTMIALEYILLQESLGDSGNKITKLVLNGPMFDIHDNVLFEWITENIFSVLGIIFPSISVQDVIDQTSTLLGNALNVIIATVPFQFNFIENFNLVLAIALNTVVQIVLTLILKLFPSLGTQIISGPKGAVEDIYVTTIATDFKVDFRYVPPFIEPQTLGFIQTVVQENTKIQNGELMLQKTPVLVMSANKNAAADEFLRIKPGDTVSDVKEIEMFSKKVGKDVTYVKIPNVYHDVFLSSKEVWWQRSLKVLQDFINK